MMNVKDWQGNVHGICQGSAMDGVKKLRYQEDACCCSSEQNFSNSAYNSEAFK
jgi:hypothetical protein